MSNGSALQKIKEVKQLLPNDPMILLSYINTKLRDDYSSLKELCDDMNEDMAAIENKLRPIDYTYNAELNKFV